MSKVLNINETFQASQIDFGIPKKGQDNKLFISLGLKTDEESPVSNFLCQFSKTSATHEIVNTNIEVGITKDISEYVSDIEEKLLDEMKAHKSEWFPDKEISDSYLEGAFMSVLRNAKRQSFFKGRVADNCQIYDNRREEIELSSITKDNIISLIIHISGVWFSKTRCGLTMKVCQIKLHDNPKIVKGTCLFEDDDEIDEMDFPDHAE
tara:strand:+ start:11740 stop:12363 length:624 start_codon:yes stop_codon:yes gene_type:complete